MDQKSVFDKIELTDQQFISKVEFYRLRYGTLIKAFEEFAKAINRNYQLGVTTKNVQNRYYYILKHKGITLEATRNQQVKHEKITKDSNNTEKKTLKPFKKFHKNKKDYVPRPVGVQFITYWDYIDMPRLIKNLDKQIEELEKLGVPTTKNDLFRYYANMFNVSLAAFVSKYNYYKKGYYSKNARASKESGSYVVELELKVQELSDKLVEKDKMIERLQLALQSTSDTLNEVTDEYSTIKNKFNETLKAKSIKIFNSLKTLLKRG